MKIQSNLFESLYEIRKQKYERSVKDINNYSIEKKETSLEGNLGKNKTPSPNFKSTSNQQVEEWLKYRASKNTITDEQKESIHALIYKNRKNNEKNINYEEQARTLMVKAAKNKDYDSVRFWGNAISAMKKN